VIFGTILIGVVGKFMIVPHRDHRQHLVQPLQVGILAIGRIAQPIIGKPNDFRGRANHSPGQSLLLRWIGSDRIFIYIIAGMHHQVQLAILGGVGIGVEIAEWQVGTADHADIELRRRPFRQGPGATDH